jgi:menaquinone-dependent protoporphyrinogen IX oxidase
MNTRVIYESRYGNTLRIARAIAARLETAGPGVAWMQPIREPLLWTARIF